MRPNLELLEEAAADARARGHPDLGVDDITYLMHEHGVDWAYYIGDDTCVFNCSSHDGPEHTVSQQNPLPWFTTIRETGQMDRIQRHADFFAAAAAGTMLSVSGHALQRRGEYRRPASRSGRGNGTSRG